MLWQILCVIALRLCAENWLWHTGWCWGINLLHCHLQCRVAVFQWVSQSSEWNQWQCDYSGWGVNENHYQGFSLCPILMQSTGERWFELLKLHWQCSFGSGQSWSEAGLFCVLILFCFVMCLEMSVIINCDTLSGLMYCCLGPAAQPSCNFGIKCDEDKPF